MTTIDQKRMLKLAGLLKEGIEEWPRGLAEEEEEVPKAKVGDLDVPMGYDVGEPEYKWEPPLYMQGEEEEYKEWLAQSLHTHAGQDNEDLPVKEPVASAEEEELERMPKRMGMGRGAGLEETYIDYMKEAIRAIVREVLLEKAKTKRK